MSHTNILAIISTHKKKTKRSIRFYKYRYATSSSDAVERLFRIGKDISKPGHCGLSDNHFDRLSFLKGNYRQLLLLKSLSY